MNSPPQTPQSRRNRSSEAEYAGPLQPETPPSSVSNSAARRLKRSGGSSDSDQTALPSHQLVIEDYRVAGPVYLPLPVMRGYGVAERYQSAWNAGLKSEVHQILSHHHISRSFVNLEKHITECGHASPRSAVYIFIEDKDLSNHAQWRIAANSILELCRQKGLNDLNIEIADLRELVPKISATISKTLSIVDDWPILLPSIMDALKPNVDWLTIDLVSRASWAESDRSASFVPTILIMIKERTEESYTAARDRICELLDPRFPEVAVEVIRGCLDNCADTRDHEPAFVHHGDKLWQEEAYMGASIQRAGSKGTGTLGCFIKLRDRQGVVRTYGLTNFHFAVPENMESHDRQMQYWIKNGLPPGSARNFQINMPSEIDLDAARDRYVQLTKDIEGDMADNNEGYKQYLVHDREYCRLAAEGLDPEFFMPKAAVHLVKDVRERLVRYREQIDAIDARKDKNNLRLGQVFAGSGIRQTGSRQLVDWAIIAVDVTRVPAKNHLPKEICGRYIYSPDMVEIGFLAVDQRVFKVGRSTNETYGFVNPVKTTKLLGWKRSKGKLKYKIGHAWVVMDSAKDDDEGKMRGSRRFSDKGDSGSAVFNQNGEFVGLLYGGTYSERMSYVMAAQVLVEEIKRITGAVEVTML